MRTNIVGEKRPNFGSPALSMKTALLGSGITENSLENEIRRARWLPWITESAGEPKFRWR